MAAKKKGPGKGRGPSTRPASPAKRITVPKPAAPKDPAAAGPGVPPAKTPPPAKAAPAAKSPAAPAAKSPAAKEPAAKAPAAKAPPATAPAPKGGGSPAKAPAPKAPKAAKAVKATGPAPKATVGGAASAKAAGATAKAAKSTGPAGKTRPRTGPTREERLAAAAAARRRQTIRNRALLAAAVAVVVVVVGLVVVSDRRERSQEAAQFQTASCQFDRESDGDSGLNRNHVPNPTFTVNPPAGGNHTAQAAGPGVFTAETAPPDGPIVHAMEHGYIVLWFRPDLDQAGQTMLRDLANKHAKDVLVVPRPSIATPVAATAWHARILCGSVEPDTIERFINEYVNEGPEKVPH